MAFSLAPQTAPRTRTPSSVAPRTGSALVSGKGYAGLNIKTWQLAIHASGPPADTSRPSGRRLVRREQAVSSSIDLSALCINCFIASRALEHPRNPRVGTASPRQMQYYPTFRISWSRGRGPRLVVGDSANLVRLTVAFSLPRQPAYLPRLATAGSCGRFLESHLRRHPRMMPSRPAP